MYIALTQFAGLLLAVWLAAAFALDRLGLASRRRGRYEAIVVLGCRVLEGGRPSEHLGRRVELAVRLWREGWAPCVVTTGGVGEHPPAEGELAARLARAAGVPEDALVVESESTSSEENARFAAALTSARRVLVVTDTYHAFRARRVFGRYFDEVDIAPAIPPWRWRVQNALREVAAVALYSATKRL